MDTKLLSIAVMHMLQERAAHQRMALDNQIIALKKMRNKVNSPITKAEMNSFCDRLTRRSQGMESVANAFDAYTEEEWVQLLQDISAWRISNGDAYDEVTKLFTIGGSSDWMDNMWK